MLKVLPLIPDFHASQGLILRIVLCHYIVWFCFGLFFAIRMSTFVSTYGRSEFGLKKKPWRSQAGYCFIGEFIGFVYI